MSAKQRDYVCDISSEEKPPSGKQQWMDGEGRFCFLFRDDDPPDYRY
jgi:hypothetical protein